MRILVKKTPQWEPERRVTCGACKSILAITSMDCVPCPSPGLEDCMKLVCAACNTICYMRKMNFDNLPLVEEIPPAYKHAMEVGDADPFLAKERAARKEKSNDKPGTSSEDSESHH